MPEPLGPATAIDSPAATRRSTPFNMWTMPASLGNATWTPASWIIASLMALSKPLSRLHTGPRRYSVVAMLTDRFAYVGRFTYVNRMAIGSICAIVMAVAIQLAATIAAAAEPVKLVALGDSLTAGLGLERDDAFPARLERALKARGHDVEITNAGVSGDTTAGGLARVDWSVGADADGVIVELGANDALRGITPSETRANLDQLISRLLERNTAVLLAGMLAPRNLGASYAAEFDRIFSDLAGKHNVIFDPFFLEGVATDARLNQADGILPTAEGAGVLVERILPLA